MEMSRLQQNWTDKDLNKVCIVGMACRLPGSDSLDSYWQNLIEGNECTHQHRQWPDGSEDKGGFLSNIKCFDPSFFNISPHEALCMDPQQRQLLEISWHAIENSGLSIETLKSLKTGIFTAGLPGDYKNLLALNKKESVNTHSFLGNAPSALSGRLSYFYDFNGPSITIDTACSSGLTALNMARLTIESAECDAALVGCVSIFSTSELHQLATHANMISPNQRCAAFDDSADGFVPSEGAAVLVLMKLQKAIDLKLHIYGLIDSLSLNHDGLSNGLMAPNPHSQQSVIQRACQQSNIDLNELAMIEAHGTGTKLGDMIELKGLTSAFDKTLTKQPCYLGASKTVIGHTLVCSGIASIIKVLLSYQNKIIPPNALFKTANQYASIEPFTINRTAMPWPIDKLYAGISAFGFTGSNAHLILKFPQYEEDRAPHTFENYFIFSAETSDKLNVIISNVSDFVQLHPELTLAELSAWLIKKPKHFACRAAIYAKDRATLLLNMQSYLESEVELISSQKTEDAIISKWLNGNDAVFSVLSSYLCPQVLPGYPFSKDEYWIGSSPSVQEKVKDDKDDLLALVKSTLASLLGYDVSDINERKSLLELGIDSLTGMQLINALQQKQIEAKMEWVWQANSLSEFAAMLGQEKIDVRSALFSSAALNPLNLYLKESTENTSEIRWVVSKQRGEPLLLLPPLNTNYLAWLRQIPLLHANGYQLHIPHYPGHYPSSFNKNENFSLQLIAEQIIHYLQKNRIHAHFVGWSLGGVLSLLVALTRSISMKSMTLISSAANFDSELFSKTIEMQNELELHQDVLSIAYNTQEAVGKYICANSEMTVLKHYYQSLIELNISAANLKTINVPTRIVYGGKDPVLSLKQEEFLATIINSKLELYADSGHFIPMTRAQRFNAALLEFIQSVECEKINVLV